MHSTGPVLNQFNVTYVRRSKVAGLTLEERIKMLQTFCHFQRFSIWLAADPLQIVQSIPRQSLDNARQIFEMSLHARFYFDEIVNYASNGMSATADQCLAAIVEDVAKVAMLSPIETVSAILKPNDAATLIAEFAGMVRSNKHLSAIVASTLLRILSGSPSEQVTEPIQRLWGSLVELSLQHRRSDLFAACEAMWAS